MGEHGKPILLNLGCGFERFAGHINVDGYAICNPDVVWDLNITPLPWAENSIDGIKLYHVIEHVENWWELFSDCARVLKVGGYFDVRMPCDSSTSAMTYRDHLNAFSSYSFYGIWGAQRGSNAWATEQQHSVPLGMISHLKVPNPQFFWMARWAPWLMEFCATHGRNFIREQRFMFVKLSPEYLEKHQPSR